MPSYGLFTTERVARERARIKGTGDGGSELFVVPATINGEDAFAVVDETDRHTHYEYDAKAEPGQRLRKREGLF